MSTHYLAVDLGAESGRVMLGTLNAGKLDLKEIHRFPNTPVFISNSWRWNILQLFAEIKSGLKKAAALGLPIRGVSTDSWGVDYVLLKGSEPMLTPSYQYRDARTDHTYEQIENVLKREDIFEETGIQFMSFNTICQFYDDLTHRRAVFDSADGFLTIADYFNYLLSGNRALEVSMASTTQLYNPRTRDWSAVILDSLGLQKSFFPKIVPSGTRLGKVTKSMAEELGLKNAEVIATCSHDTGAAVASVPAEGKGWAYMSSGTWSLLGVERTKPVISLQSRALNYTNEIGYGNSVRFLKNIVGLWLVQECRRQWLSEGTEYSYEQLGEMAAAAKPLQFLINPDDPRFVKAGDMPQKIAAYCRERGQAEPKTPGEFIRCALESLALLYRKSIANLENITGEKIDRLHIVGGGIKNKLFNQIIADAIGRTVITGPVEGTAAGNILIQAIAMGELKSLAELRTVVRNSFEVETWKPVPSPAWDKARQQFLALALK